METGVQGSRGAVRFESEDLWSVLAGDVQRPIAVVGPDCALAFVNDQFLQQIAGRGTAVPASTVVGKTLAELWPGPIGQERQTFCRRVTHQDRPILLVERLRGRWSRTIFRRLREMAVGGGGQAAPLRGEGYVLLMFHLGTGPEGAEQSGTRYEVIRASHDDPGELANLSPRELEVLALIGAGLSTRDIAEKLGRTVKTVEWHRASLGRKLDITNRVELAQIAISAGLVANGARRMD